MAFNGTGTFLRIYNWVTDKVNGVPITASRFDAELDGMATGLSNCITKDGQTTITANIPLNSNKLTGVGSGTARTDTINVGQVQDNQFLYLGTTGGGADVYTLAPSPAITAYTATQQFTAKISATNLTITPYLQISSIASPATTAVIKKLSATKTEIAVEVSDLLINGIYDFKRNSANDAWIVLNPEKAFYDLTNLTNLTNLTKATSTTQGISFSPNPITIANNATDANNDIDFSAGNFKFSDKSNESVLLAMTKRLDALWTAGTNQGGLDTGSKANSTWYHCYAIHNPTSDVSDAIFSTNATTPTLPSDYTKYYLIESIKTDVSGNILAFSMDGDTMTWVARPLDIGISAPVSTAKIDYPMSIPLGRQVIVNLGGNCSSSSGSQRSLFILSPLQSSITPTGTDCDVSTENSINGSIAANVLSNTSSQISMIANASSNFEIKIRTRGWKKP
jgi:hypothetical protein